MCAREVLSAAIRDGRLVRGDDVSGETWPDAARTYLADGSGMAWQVPEALRGRGVFVIDAEIVVPVRASLVRRYGVTDPDEFAELWTRAECLAKLTDLPIITWLQRHRLDIPAFVTGLVERDRLAWVTENRDGIVITRAVLLPHEADG